MQLFLLDLFSPQYYLIFAHFEVWKLIFILLHFGEIIISVHIFLLGKWKFFLKHNTRWTSHKFTYIIAIYPKYEGIKAVLNHSKTIFEDLLFVTPCEMVCIQVNDDFFQKWCLRIHLSFSLVGILLYFVLISCNQIEMCMVWPIPTCPYNPTECFCPEPDSGFLLWFLFFLSVVQTHDFIVCPHSLADHEKPSTRAMEPQQWGLITRTQCDWAQPRSMRVLEIHENSISWIFLNICHWTRAMGQERGTTIMELMFSWKYGPFRRDCPGLGM